ncbi:MAG: hypothetical protein V1799_07490 [bacterium]
MYDFRDDITELQNTLQTYYDEVYDDFESAINGVEGESESIEREKLYALLRQKVEGLDNIPMKANPEVESEVRQEFIGEQSGFTKGLPFYLAFGLSILSSRVKAYRGGVGELYQDIRSEQNKRFHDFRIHTKGLRSNEKVFDYARSNMINVPDKEVLEKRTASSPFSLKIGINFDAKYREFNEKARDFLFNKDFKIRSMTMTNNLKEKLRSSLASGYASGDSKARMANRVQSILGPKSNAQTIAITEVANAVNHGEWNYASEYRDYQGVEMIKTWFQIFRGSRRKAHTEVMGQTLKFEEKYMVDGEPMLRPHDPDASARNTIRCGCYLEYQLGTNVLKGSEDNRGVRRYIKSVETASDNEPYINAERIGDFVNVDDAADYVRDIYGITVDRRFTIDRMNSMARILDSMPYEVMLKNMKLTEVFATGAAAANVAEYVLDGRWMRFNENKELSDSVFEHVFSHELGHSLQYQYQELYEKFCQISWKRTGEGGVFNPKHWQRNTKGGFLTGNSLLNTKEHFADSVSWYVTRNSEMLEAAKRQAKRSMPELLKIFELFSQNFGPVRP